MDKSIFGVLSSCHYWDPNILQVRLLAYGQEERLPGWKWLATGTLTYLSPHSKKRRYVPARSLQSRLPHESGHAPPSGWQLRTTVPENGWFSYQTRQKLQVPTKLFSSWELNKNHLQWKFIRKYKCRWLWWPLGTEFSTALGFHSYN